jgi:NAD(P)-dependent dehydrogenase (short-subunit alcohol dehydrogenase family)
VDPSKRPSYPDLEGKVAFVTGGSRGIGAATCRMLAENGVRVAVNGRDRAAIDRVDGPSATPTATRSRHLPTARTGRRLPVRATP